MCSLKAMFLLILCALVYSLILGRSSIVPFGKKAKKKNLTYFVYYVL